MTHDERLVPAQHGRGLDGALTDLARGKTYNKYGTYGAADGETSLKQYLFIILKRKWLILSLVLIISSLATIQAYRDPNIYQGATTMKIEQKTPSILQSGTNGGIVIGKSDPNFWGTQLKLLQDHSLARQVVLTLDLQHNPNFFGAGSRSGVFDSLKRIFSREQVAAKPQPPKVADAQKEEDLRDHQYTPEELTALEPYEDTIIASETVEPIPATNLVVIKYIHTDPQLARQIADALADVFVANNEALQDNNSSKAAQELSEGIAKYQAQTQKKQQDIFTYAKTYNLPLGADQTQSLADKQLSTYSDQLLAAENQSRNLQALYDAAKSSTDPLSNPEIQKDERITKLRVKLSDLKDKETGLLQRYTPEWPEVKQVQAQIKEVEADLAKAPSEVLSVMKQRADAARNQLRSLQGAYSKQNGITTEQTKHVIELASMRADLASDQQYLNVLYQKRRELSATQDNGGGTSVTISDRSRLPRAPVGPARMQTIMIALVLSLAAGIGLAFILDFLDDTIKTVDDVDRYIHLPALALIPAVRGERARLKSVEAKPNETTALAMVKDVRSPIAESYRHLRTSLLLSSAGTAPKTILVTSSQPSEGKTTTAINTAFILAQTGAEVLIIDCDLRRPRLHAHFNIPNAKGLTNRLSGEEMDMDQLIQPYAPLPNLKLLPSGPMPPNPAELLGSEEMRKLLVSLGERFTHVIVDSPPAISFTDASILSTFCDGVILVVHGGRSSRAVVRRAKQQLMDVGAHIYGVVLNNVKVEKTRDYYYGGYYSSHYYTDDEAEESSTATTQA